MLNGDVTENADVNLKLFSKKTKHCHKENGRAGGPEEEHEVSSRFNGINVKDKKTWKFLLTNLQKSTEIPLDWI